MELEQDNLLLNSIMPNSISLTDSNLSTIGSINITGIDNASLYANSAITSSTLTTSSSSASSSASSGWSICSSPQYATVSYPDAILNDTYSHAAKPVSCTKINGLEEVVFLKKDDIVKMSRINKRIVKLTRKFPFVSISRIECTDLAYANDSAHKKIKHLFVLECPSRIASRLGIEYEKANCQDLVDDDLTRI